jgi:hypothetical protein
VTMSTPSCTLPTLTTTTPAATSAVVEPEREAVNVCVEKPFMCAPAGW